MPFRSPVRPRWSPAVLAVALPCALLAACATGPAPDARVAGSLARTPTVVENGGGARLDLETFRDTRALAQSLDHPVDAVFAALPAALDTLGVPVTMRSDADRVIGTEALVVRARLAGQSVSRYLDCGRGAAGAELADTYEVTMLVLAQAIPTADGATRLLVRVDGRAKPHAVSGNPISCATTGRLEARLAAEVDRRAR